MSYGLEFDLRAIALLLQSKDQPRLAEQAEAAIAVLDALRTVHRVLQGEQVLDIMLTEKGPTLGEVISDALGKADS